jgi:hypothetical protein
MLPMELLRQLRMFGRFAIGLPRFLSATISPEETRTRVLRDVLQRERNFLLLLRRGVYEWAESPYKALLKWAGVEFGDLEKLVAREGIEASLEKLYDAGVKITLDEFKGKRPIVRNGLIREVTAEDFDNPLLAREFELETGGSTGARRRLAIDFALLEHEAADQYLYYAANGMMERPAAIWRPVPPGSAGLKNALNAAKVNRPLKRWFSPQQLSLQKGMLSSTLFTGYAVTCGQLMGGALPYPRYTPLDQAVEVARWAAEMKAAGSPAFISLAAGNAVRVATAALDAHLDIAGTIFRVGGEPLTAGKYEVIRRADADTVSSWAVSEAGLLGGGCARRSEVDEVHLFTGKIAVIQQPVEVDGGTARIEILHLTTLLPQAPKIMINVNIGDYGVLQQRHCGCPLEEVGLHLHLHGIRNYEKLTVNGMHFVGAQLADIVEKVLPALLGGSPMDYQFVEEERNAESLVTVVVSPRVGALSDGHVVNVVLKALGSGSRGDRMMAENWRQGEVLQVARKEPYITPSGKTPAVRVVRNEKGGAL